MRGADAIATELDSLRRRVVRAEELGKVSKEYKDEVVPKILELMYLTNQEILSPVTISN